MTDDDLPLVEPISVVDTVISGIADIEDMGDGMLRLVCYVKRKNPHDHRPERVIVANIVMSKETLVRNMLACAKPVDLCVVAEVEALPRMGETLN